MFYFMYMGHKGSALQRKSCDESRNPIVCRLFSNGHKLKNYANFSSVVYFSQHQYVSIEHEKTFGFCEYECQRWLSCEYYMYQLDAAANFDGLVKFGDHRQISSLVQNQIW